MSFAVKEAFLTLQGEGQWAGYPAVFLRFAGCNVWSGHEEHRERDVSRGACAAWCDTNFVGTDGTNGGVFKYAAQLAEHVLRVWGQVDMRHRSVVVCTGGEPGLQLTAGLVDALHDAGFYVHVETNGSVRLPETVDWVTLSPKPPMQVVAQRYHELKVIYPAGIDPLVYEAHVVQSTPKFVQPLDNADSMANLKHCIDFVLQHRARGWRLGCQMHKVVGLP